MMNGSKLCAAGLAVILVAGTSVSAQAQDRAPKSGVSMPADGKGVVLHTKFQPGQTFNLTQKIDRTITMGFEKMNMSQTITMSTTFGWDAKVLSADDKESVLEMTLKSVSTTHDESTKQGEADAGSKKGMWDSSKHEDDKDAQNPMMKAFRPLVGAKYKVTFGPDGEITGAEAEQAIPVMATNYQPFVSPVTDATEFKMRWQPFFAPKIGVEPVAVGQSWETEHNTLSQQIGTMRSKTTRTFVKNDAGKCQIAIKGSMDILPASEGETPKAELKDQSITGDCMWDAKSGMCSSLNWNQKYTMAVNAQGMQITRGSDSKMTITRN